MLSAMMYAWSDEQLLGICRLEPLGSRTPGGQHANRHGNGVRLVVEWADQRLVAQADEQRERPLNRALALKRLRLQLALVQRGGSDPAWLDAHRQGTRLRVSAEARDLHLVAAVLLDALSEQAGALRPAAAQLAIATSQLVRTLAIDAQLWAAADALRRRAGLSSLRRPR